MADSKYGVIKAKQPEFPVRELLVVPHKGEDLIVSFPAFGENTYRGNLESIGQTYSHPQTGEKMHFKPAIISESISAVAYDFENIAKQKIFDPIWLQAGYVVRTQDGVFTNTTETDNSRLRQFLDEAEEVNGIYLRKDGIGFAPYESFERGKQDIDTFTQGGLARVLEHTNEKVAKNLREIGSPKFYKKGVNVWGFDSVKDPVLRVASLYSCDDRLDVVGDDWDGYYGCAFGVLNKSRSDAPKN